MISRYSLPEMEKVWSEENKWECLKKVEVAVALVQGDKGLIPKSAAQKIKAKASFSIDRIKEIEAETKHDVIAFVSNMAENVGPQGKYIHFGLTSSDVIDTGLALQIQEGGPLILEKIEGLEKALIKIIRDHYNTLCVGRTHGIQAEPTTFGFKMAGFLSELGRNKVRVQEAFKACNFGQFSGAVGTHSYLSPAIEKAVLKSLGLIPEPIATQVIPRDRHAQLMQSFSLLGAFIERLSVELRHLQRTEVSEVIEGFTKGQKGSSAMPHKKNPISAENLTGVARLLRGYAQSSIENVALWHERDISHSSVERVVFPDAFIILHYALNRMTGILGRLFVDKDKMLENHDLLGGQIYSSHLLLYLVEAGVKREDAYKWVQTCAHTADRSKTFKQLVLEHKDISKHVPRKKLENLFSGKLHLKHIKNSINKVLPKTKQIKGT